MPLAATLATGEVFEAFKTSSKVDALLHGHSYSGYPIGCAAAVEALRILGSPQNPSLCTLDRCVHQPCIAEVSGRGMGDSCGHGYQAGAGKKPEAGHVCVA